MKFFESKEKSEKRGGFVLAPAKQNKKYMYIFIYIKQQWWGKGIGFFT